MKVDRIGDSLRTKYGRINYEIFMKLTILSCTIFVIIFDLDMFFDKGRVMDN